MKNLFNRASKLALAGALLGLGAVAQADAFVAYNTTTHTVDFNPSVAIDPIINGAVSAVLAGVALFVVGLGVRYVYRMAKASK